ncbi:RHS repeat-associated core domain-containing protein [Pseudomonas sp. Z3-8]|uniref:RHS repeat-associated core domain-containing protein n=1 Tax=Pseudomonas sp. Z3-8 TaxID=2817412 RepID=UPI003DA7C654
MPSTDETLLCRYHYDPLDRLADCIPAAQASAQRFYLKQRLTSEIQGSVQRSIFQHDDQLLAQQYRENEIGTATLLATDQQRSVLRVLDTAQSYPLAYTVYGHRSQENGLLSLLGFNGERPDPVTGHYLLGKGYRAFNPVLMRLNSPDSLSPFGKGGLNPYAYCLGDPVNYEDLTGHIPLRGLFRSLRQLFAPIRKTRSSIKNAKQSSSPPVSPAAKKFTDSTRDFIGFHGTSRENAEQIIKKGIRSKSKGDSFFVTNTFDSANNYSSLQKNGAVLEIYSNDIDQVRSFSTRSMVKQSNVPQLKIPEAAHRSLSFKIVSSTDRSSNFNRFMTEQESAAYWIGAFRKQL